jgi:hypothetical protein
MTRVDAKLWRKHVAVDWPIRLGKVLANRDERITSGVGKWRLRWTISWVPVLGWTASDP